MIEKWLLKIENFCFVRIGNSQLKKFIIDAGLIGEKELVKAEKKAKKTKQKLVDFLIKEKIVGQEQISKLQAYILGIPFVNLEKEKIDKEVLQIIPEPIARRHNIVAFRKKDKDLEVAMLDPDDLQTIEFIKKKSDLKILPRLTTEKSIKNALKQYQRSLEAEFGDLIKKESGAATSFKSIKGGPVPGKEEGNKEDLEKEAEQLPIIKIVDTLLKHAILQRGSERLQSQA